jgi:hypothetical protein
VVAAIGFLFGFWGIIELGPSDLRSLQGLFVCVAVGWNIGVLATTWLGLLQRSYRFSVFAARLMFGSWFFFLFTGCPIPVSILGLMVSIVIGIWAVSTLRKPDVRAILGQNAESENLPNTLLGSTLGNRWTSLDQRKKIIASGGCTLGLVLLVVLMSWLTKPKPGDQPQGNANLADFAKVDYSIPAVDYSRGPKGEAIQERRGPNEKFPEQEEGVAGYTASNGIFIRHGKTIIWHAPPPDGSIGPRSQIELVVQERQAAGRISVQGR